MSLEDFKRAVRRLQLEYKDRGYLWHDKQPRFYVIWTEKEFWVIVKLGPEQELIASNFYSTDIVSLDDIIDLCFNEFHIGIITQ